MNDEELKELTEGWDKLRESINEIAKILVEAFNEAVKVVKYIAHNFKKLFIEYYIQKVKETNNKKACKWLHILLHTKNNRIKKKQIKKLNQYLLNYYMPL